MLKSKKLKVKRKKFTLDVNGIIFLFLFSLLAFSFSLFSYAEQEFTYDAKGKRNPFIALVTNDGRLLKLEQEETQTEPGLLLEGIIYDKNGLSYAIVNGSVVKIGDAVGSYQVLKIEPNKVIFIKEGETREIELKKEEE
ncbi:MAG: hypothetical protein NTW64_03080 [Candidatus Omnitrophica bacterium]|nr:hypothetical protein [Candidatus Omnitrophota bacterium]